MIKKILDKLILQCISDTAKRPLRIIMGFNIRHQFYSELDMFEWMNNIGEDNYRGIPVQFEESEKLVRVEL
jgi:hypothetical protein